ncbi:hypothetical protein COOONC_21317 [Cooperia oncophora]
MLGEVNVQDIEDALGNSMKFLQLISTNLEGGTMTYACARQLENETILLGTNALESLVGGAGGSTTGKARVVARVLVPPSGTSNVNITVPILEGERVLRSSTERIGSGVCHIENGTTVVHGTNQSKQPWTLGKGDCVGCWTNRTWFTPNSQAIQGDMLQMEIPEVAPKEHRTKELLSIFAKNRTESLKVFDHHGLRPEFAPRISCKKGQYTKRIL